ncbi:MAG: hypothetical protein KF690_12415 [Bacteroidetes bacterium]|nr:hypothetical protein [Bacteroidota bacterium]
MKSELSLSESRYLAWQQCLRRLRGHNLYRGRAVWQQQPACLLLECGPVRGGVPCRRLTVLMGREDADSYFLWEGRRVSLPEKGGLQPFLEEALACCRGKSAYIRTRDDAADYK